MFGSKKPIDNTTNTQATSTSGSTNSLVQGTHVDGKINANNDIRIDGSLKGELKCKGRVIIGKDGSVEGEVYCQNAVIEGSFDGKLDVVDTLQVKDTAKITGDVKTGNLVVQAGASFDVSCGMGSQKVKNINTSNGVPKLQNAKEA